MRETYRERKRELETEGGERWAQKVRKRRKGKKEDDRNKDKGI